MAVEPIPEMRAKLSGVNVFDGTAEKIPLSEASVDLVTVGQAFHWFDAPKALAECRRVLRPGGTRAMLWNVRDETVDWVRELGQIKDEVDGGPPYRQHQEVDWEAVVAAAGGYEAHVVDWFPNWQFANVEVVVARTASTSWISALPHDRREVVLDRVRELLATDPATRDRNAFWFPHDTVVRRWRTTLERSR